MRFKVPFALLAAGAALLAAPAASPAKSLVLTGQVVGASFPSGSRTAVPVLLHRKAMRRARLRGPLALLTLPRSARPRVPGGKRVTLAELRAGDAFRVRMPVPRAARRSAYPVMRAGAAAFAVTRRGTAPSAAELQAQIYALTGYVHQLTIYVVAELADLRGQIAALRADVTGLSTALDQLRARVDALPTDLQNQINTLIGQVSALQTQLQALTTQLAGLTSDLAGLSDKLTGIAPGDLADALADIAALQALVGGVDVTALSGSLSTLASQVGTVGGTDLQTQVNQVNGALTSAQATLDHLCDSAELVTGDPLLGLVGLSNLTGCP